MADDDDFEDLEEPDDPDVVDLEALEDEDMLEVADLDEEIEEDLDVEDEEEEEGDDEDEGSTVATTTTAAAADEEEEEDDEEVPETEERADTSTKVLPKRPGEFVCESCFLLKHPSQLADPVRMLCRDCV